MPTPIFEVKNLDVRFSTPDGEVHAVKNANFRIDEGECLGVVGESGSGKSQLFLSTIGLLSGNGVATGSVLYRGREILGLSERKLNELRGSKITMIFQDPLTSLTPHLTVGAQLMETLRVHQRVQPDEAQRRVLEALELVRIPEAKQRATRAKPAIELSAFQPVSRDFAFIVDRTVKAGDILRAASSVDRKLITGVTVFDVYEGKGIDEAKKSVAIAVTIQPREKTMTDQEIDAVAARIVAEVNKKTGGSLR